MALDATIYPTTINGFSRKLEPDSTQQDQFKTVEAKAHSVPSKKHPSDSVLVHALQKREEWAFTLLIDQYHSRLLRFTMTFVPNRSVAEEIVKTTWMEVLEEIGEFDGHTTLKSWIFTTLYTQMRRFPEISFSPSSGNASQGLYPLKHQFHDKRNSPDSPPHSIKDNPGSQDVNTSQHEPSLTQRIEHTLTLLTPIQRQVTLLRDREQFAASEICAILHIGENTYLTELHITRTMLNTKLHFTPKPRGSA